MIPVVGVTIRSEAPPGVHSGGRAGAEGGIVLGTGGAGQGGVSSRATE